MDYSKLREPLDISQIDFRVQQITKTGGAIVLAYKDARVDMDRLDSVVGANNWKREHSNGNANCTVSIWDNDKSQWVSKEDTGTESYSDKEKGLASDSFKRACFNWGIGRELYDYPFIYVKLNPDEFEVKDNKAKATNKLRIKDWVWKSEFIDGKLSYLSCWTEEKERWSWGKRKEELKPESEMWEVVIGAILNGKRTIEQVYEKFIITKENKLELESKIKNLKELA